MARIAIGVTPSAHADDCADGDMKYSAMAALWYIRIAVAFREGATMPPTWHGNPCTEGDTFTSRGASVYTYVIGRASADRPLSPEKNPKEVTGFNCPKFGYPTPDWSAFLNQRSEPSHER